MKYFPKNQENKELGFKFKMKVPVQKKSWCVCCYLTILHQLHYMFLLIVWNMMCFIAVEFTERQSMVTCSL